MLGQYAEFLAASATGEVVGIGQTTPPKPES